MLDQYEFSTFINLSELVRRHRFRDFSENLQEHLRSRSSNLEHLGRQMMDMFQYQLSKYYTTPGKFFALDIGVMQPPVQLWLGDLVGLWDWIPTCLFWC
jgi:hypothetical protein